MSSCCCSLAGTISCKFCTNNPNAEILNSYYNYGNNYCPNRLSCGYCTILHQMCPLNYPQITFTNTTTPICNYQSTTTSTNTTEKSN